MTEPTPPPAAPVAVPVAVVTPPEPLSTVVLLAEISGEVGPIGKHSTMSGPGSPHYSYRSIESIDEAAWPHMIARRIVATPEVLSVERETRKTSSGGSTNVVHLTIRWTFHGPRCDHFTGQCDPVEAVTIGEAADSSDKATNKAHTSSRKLAVVSVLNIPHSAPDPDHERIDAAPEAARRRSKAQHPAGRGRRGEGGQGDEGDEGGALVELGAHDLRVKLAAGHRLGFKALTRAAGVDKPFHFANRIVGRYPDDFGEHAGNLGRIVNADNDLLDRLNTCVRTMFDELGEADAITDWQQIRSPAPSPAPTGNGAGG